MSKIPRYASIAAISLALIDAAAIWNGQGFLYIFREKQAAFLYLFSVAFFMASGFAYIVRRPKIGTSLLLLGVLFAVRAGFTLPEGAWLPPG
jgi:hypothetical protein